jgi:hypothetical protein
MLLDSFISFKPGDFPPFFFSNKIMKTTTTSLMLSALEVVYAF